MAQNLLGLVLTRTVNGTGQDRSGARAKAAGRAAAAASVQKPLLMPAWGVSEEGDEDEDEDENEPVAPPDERDHGAIHRRLRSSGPAP